MSHEGWPMYLKETLGVDGVGGGWGGHQRGGRRLTRGGRWLVWGGRWLVRGGERGGGVAVILLRSSPVT